MALLYDIIMIIIVILFCISGARRGIVRSIVMFVILILSLLVGYLASGFLAEPVYDSYVKERVVNCIKEPIENFDTAEFVNKHFFDNKLGIKISDEEIEKALGESGDISESISSYAKSKGIPISSNTISDKIDSLFKDEEVKSEVEKSLPSYLVPAFDSAASNDSKMFGDMLRSLAKTDKDEATEELTDIALKPIILIALKAVLFVLCFIVIWIILRIIVAVTRLGKNKETGGINTVLGGLLGAVKGLLVVFLITAIISTVSPVFSLSDSGSSFTLSETAINNSVFLRIMNDILN